MNPFIDITQTVLRTSRATLRPWRQEDLEDLYAYASVDGVGQPAGWLPHWDLAESQRVLDMFMEGRRVFALEVGGHVKGSVGIEKYSEEMHPGLADMRCAELGAILAKDLWGQGIMTEALREAIRFCFEDLGLDAVVAGHRLDNLRSKRMQEKCGLRHYSFEPHRTAWGEDVPSETRILLRSEWEQIQKK